MKKLFLILLVCLLPLIASADHNAIVEQHVEGQTLLLTEDGYFFGVQSRSTGSLMFIGVWYMTGISMGDTRDLTLEVYGLYPYLYDCTIKYSIPVEFFDKERYLADPTYTLDFDIPLTIGCNNGDPRVIGNDIVLIHGHMDLHSH